MIDLSWQIEEDRDTELTGAPRPLLGTWHYLRSALRRERRLWMGVAVLGALLGLATLVVLPPSSKATVTLLMVHTPNVDGGSAMATDVSLLATREVATRTTRVLGLDMAPEDFQASISAEPVTTEILKITVAAPDDPSAVTRTEALTRQYLQFRAEQLRSLSSGLIAGYQSRIDTMQDQVDALNREYTVATAKGAGGQEQASDILTRRTQLHSQIIDMQQAIEDASLNADAAISSTHVIDSATLAPNSVRRSLALNVGAGLIAGTGLGVGFVLFRALTSTKVRRRQDVALALGAPVRLSVGSPGPMERRLGLRLFRRSWRQRDLEALAHGLSAVVLSRGGPALPMMAATPRPTQVGAPESVALAAIGNSRAGAEIVGALADHLRDLGRAVLLVDLTASAALVRWAGQRRGHRRPRGRAAGRGSRRAEPHRVHRPSGVVGLARGPLAPPADQDLRASWEAADVVLVLADVDPGVDAEHLATWVDHVVPLVTAGRSTPELLQTTAELVRTAGLPVPFALMVGSDDSDESLGLSDVDLADRAGSARLL